MRLLFLCSLGFGSVMGAALTLSGQQSIDSTIEPLAMSAVIAAFEKGQGAGNASTNEPGVTVDELTAAIRASLLTDSKASGGISADTLRELLKRKSVPAGSFLELITFSDIGGEFVFDVRDIYLRIPATSGGQTGVPVRKRLIASRTLAEEIARIELLLKSAPELPGRYRIEERLQDLRKRSANLKAE